MMNSEKYQNTLEACLACVIECKHCINSCLGEQEIDRLAKCIKLAQDCSGICLLSIDYIASGSKFANKLNDLCAEICIACAEECEKHSHMAHCKVCAEVCRTCADKCTSMEAMEEMMA